MSTAVVTEAARVTRPTADVAWWRDEHYALHVVIGPGANRRRLGRAWRAVWAVIRELENPPDGRPPAWTVEAEFSGKPGLIRPGHATNRDIYGIDIVDGQPLAVVQVRHWQRSRYQARRGLCGRTSRMWFLVGRNEETKNPFAHPISPRRIVRELRADTPPARPVTLARMWVFQTDESLLPRIIRQGDVALIPVEWLPGGKRFAIPGRNQIVTDHHVLQAAEMWCYDRGPRRIVYARDPYLQHMTGQHADVHAVGWYRVQVGLRSTVRPFARMVGD